MTIVDLRHEDRARELQKVYTMIPPTTTTAMIGIANNRAMVRYVVPNRSLMLPTQDAPMKQLIDSARKALEYQVIQADEQTLPVSAVMSRRELITRVANIFRNSGVEGQERMDLATINVTVTDQDILGILKSAGKILFNFDPITLFQGVQFVARFTEHFRNGLQEIATAPENVGIQMSRRDALKTMLGLLVTGVMLSACDPASSPKSVAQPAFQPVPGEHPISQEEWRNKFESSGMDGIAQSFFNEQIQFDEQLAPDAKQLLAVYYTSNNRLVPALQQATVRVQTPEFMLQKGLSIGDNVTREVFKTRIVNGGLMIFDPATKTYVKMILKSNANYAKYLEASVNAWRTGWEAAGIKPEMIKKLNVFEITFEGQQYMALSTPCIGRNLESAINSGSSIGKAGLTKEQVTKLLEDYFIKVLTPMNKKGFIQRDLQFKNTIVVEDDGPLRLAPIDLDGTQYMVDKSLVAQWQYAELADRAQRGDRAIKLPSFDQFVAQHRSQLPDIEPVIRQIADPLDIKINGAPVKVIIPKEFIDGLTGDDKFKVVEDVRRAILAKTNTTAQGGIIEIDIVGANKKPFKLEIVKTAALGEEVEHLGSRAAKVLSGFKSALDLGNKALLAYFAMDMIEELMVPKNRIVLTSSVATPDQLSYTKNTELSGNLDSMHQALMAKKGSVVQQATAGPWDSKNFEDMERFLGITYDEYIHLTVDLHVDFSHQSVKDYFNKKVSASILPPAEIQIEFADPFPFIIGAARVPLDGYISAMEDDKYKAFILWQKGSNVATSVIYMDKQNQGKGWDIFNLSEKSWSAKLSLFNGKVTLGCVIDNSALGKNQYKLTCKEDK